ncbi:MAG: hypothetical protein ACLPND_10300 [Candidatus Korobacteraceae bacterium]|jgi:hypothetical protein
MWWTVYAGPSNQSQPYVFKATVVPSVPLGYLTLWPDGPFTSGKAVKQT